MNTRDQSTVLDELLVFRCQAGDRRAFELLGKKWNTRLLRYATRITKDGEAAQDIVQDTWIAIINGLRGLNDPARFSAWAMRIVANKCRDWIRREQSRRGAMSDLAVDADTAPETKTQGRFDGLLEGLRLLPENQRTVLRMFYLEELTISEVAELLAVPVGTVKSRLFHARKALGRNLEEG